MLFISGCKTVAPEKVREEHYAYNHAITQTFNEQLLLNIVYLKYHDSNSILEISSVVADRKFPFNLGTGSNGINIKAFEDTRHEKTNEGMFRQKFIKTNPLRAAFIKGDIDETFRKAGCLIPF